MSILFYCIVIVFLILFPEDTAESAFRALQIWGTSIVPTLFPYMVFCRLLCKSLKTIHLPSGPAVAALGLLGGSPNGAAMIVSHTDSLSSRGIYSLCALTGTISPMFILGSIYSWTESMQLCRILLFCHWAAALLCAWIVWLTHKNSRLNYHQCSDIAVHHPMLQSIDAILQVGGCVILFSVLGSIFAKVLRPFSFLHPIIHVLLEISGGVHAILESSLPFQAKSILLSAALSFGGLSILSQNHSQLKLIGISMRTLLAFSFLRAMISVILTCLCIISFS